jgi:hypothetical protein
MTYECEFPQAELGKGLNSTTERKQMSSKTTFKRIALVAVAALGLGSVTIVSANATPPSTITGIAAGTSGAARVGAAATNTLTVSNSAAFASGENTAVYAKVISAPAGSAFATQLYSGSSFVDGVQATGTPNKAVHSELQFLLHLIQAQFLRYSAHQVQQLIPVEQTRQFQQRFL